MSTIEILAKLSTRREPGDRIPHSVLPLTEGGYLIK
jgi:hypothetical protein